MDKYPKNLLDEWNEFHVKNIFGILIPFYLEFCGKYSFIIYCFDIISVSMT
jgi:hypothetical protein